MRRRPMGLPIRPSPMNPISMAMLPSALPSAAVRRPPPILPHLTHTLSPSRGQGTVGYFSLGRGRGRCSAHRWPPPQSRGLPRPRHPRRGRCAPRPSPPGPLLHQPADLELHHGLAALVLDHVPPEHAAGVGAPPLALLDHLTLH